MKALFALLFAAAAVLLIVDAAGVSCPGYCVQVQTTVADREACVRGCVVGAAIPVGDVIPPASAVCACNVSAPCFVGCSRVLRCAKCYDGYCEATEDGNGGFVCTAPRLALSAVQDSGSTDHGERSGLAIAAYCFIALVVVLAVLLLILHKRRKDESKVLRSLAPPPAQADDKFSMVSNGQMPGDPIYYRAKNHHVYDSLPPSLLHNPSHILYDNLRRKPRGTSIQEHDYQQLEDPPSSHLASAALAPHAQSASTSRKGSSSSAALSLSVSTASSQGPAYAKLRKHEGPAGRVLRIGNSGTGSSSPISDASVQLANAPSDEISSLDSSSNFSTLAPTPVPVSPPSPAAPGDGASLIEGWDELYVPLAQLRNTKLHGSETDFLARARTGTDATQQQQQQQQRDGSETLSVTASRSLAIAAGPDAQAAPTSSSSDSDSLAGSRRASAYHSAQASRRTSVDPAADAATIAAAAAATAAAHAAALGAAPDETMETMSVALSACDLGEYPPAPNHSSIAPTTPAPAPVPAPASEAVYEAPVPASSGTPKMRMDSLATRYGYGEAANGDRGTELADNTVVPAPAPAALAAPATATTASNTVTYASVKRRAPEPPQSRSAPLPPPLPTAASTPALPTLSSIALARRNSLLSSAPSGVSASLAGQTSPDARGRMPTLTSLPSLLAIPLPTRSTSPTPSAAPSGLSSLSFLTRRELLFRAAPNALPDTDSAKPWFHGLMSRAQAAALLRRTIRSVPAERRDGVFLVREQADAPIHDRLFLSVFTGGCVHEYRITFTNCRFHLDHMEAVDSRRGSTHSETGQVTTPFDNSMVERSGYVCVSDLVKAHQAPTNEIRLTGFVDRVNCEQ